MFTRTDCMTVQSTILPLPFSTQGNPPPWQRKNNTTFANERKSTVGWVQYLRKIQHQYPLYSANGNNQLLLPHSVYCAIFSSKKFTMIRNQHSAEIVAFTELMLLLGQQICFVIISLMWFKDMEERNLLVEMLLPIVLANAGFACIQLALNLYLIKGIATRDVYKCKIWFTANAVIFSAFIPSVFFGVLLMPTLSQFLGVVLVYVTYRGVSLKIIKDFTAEVALRQRNSQKELLLMQSII